MVAGFRKRFWISLAITVPVLFLSPMIQAFLGFEEAVTFPGDMYVLWALFSAVFFYGGWPFLKGLFEELAKKQPAMMTLIAVAIATAYVYSSVIVFGLKGKILFWELATLIDIMLLGHWVQRFRHSAGRRCSLQPGNPYVACNGCGAHVPQHSYSGHQREVFETHKVNPIFCGGTNMEVVPAVTKSCHHCSRPERKYEAFC